MTLKKTYAASFDPMSGLEIIPQRDIDMHPFEEVEHLAKAEMHKLIKTIPEKPSKDEEHEWLLEFGADYVKQKRDEWQKAFDDAQPAILEAEKIWRNAEANWNDHAIKAYHNGFDPDTHPDARNLTLPKELK